MARSYDNRKRAAGAQRTKLRIIDAAADCFTERGYASTSLGHISERAGVSVETVKKVFGTKRHLLRAWFDHLVGGDESAPVAEQQAMKGVAEGHTLAQRLSIAAEALTDAHRRIAPAYRVVAAATHADPDVARWWNEEQTRRTHDVSTVTAVVLGDAPTRHDHAQLLDELFVLSDPHLYLELTGTRGWTDADYATWFARVAHDAIQHLADPSRRTQP